MILHLVYTCCHLLSHQLLVLHPNEHVSNLDLLKELYTRIIQDSWTVCSARRERASTSHDQTALRKLHDLDGGPSTRISDVAAATPEETETHHLILCASWESDLRDCGTVFNLAPLPRQSYTKSQHHEWRTINSKKRKKCQQENCLQSAHKWFSNVCIWLVLGDLIFCGM